MSKAIRYYKNVNSEIAYMAGITEALIVPVEMALAGEHYDIDTDVLWVGDKRIDFLYDAILDRLAKYNAVDNYDLDLERDSFMPNLPITKLEGCKTTDSVTNILKEYVKTVNLGQVTKDFFFSINWYLNLPRAVYRTDMQALYEYMPELEKALRAFYLFVISEIVFVEYDGYVLMLVVGSSD